MKKIITILFLFIFLCAYTEFGQLLKLPALIHHYIEHHDDKYDDDHDISFVDFLKKHYSESDSHSDNTKHNHQNLPFKSINCHSLNTVIAFVQLNTFTFHTTSVISVKNITAYTEQRYSSTLFGNIWQPPRLG